MITVVCWLWTGERVYKPEYANTLRRMFVRHLKVPHRFVCITDETEGFDPEVEVMPMPAAAREIAHVKSPEGGVMPSCYRRLWLFSDEARCLGERVLMTDVDVVLVGDITHLVKRDELFVGWRPMQSWGTKDRVAGGLYLLTTGSHPEVWNDFNADGIAAARAAGYRGSDQAWISYKLGAGAATWLESDGIHALSDLRGDMLMPHTRMVQFAGYLKPWRASHIDWVRKHYGSDDQVPKAFADLVGLHAGKRICVMGGAPTLREHMSYVRADVVISCNAHGFDIRDPDYLIAMDDQHGHTRESMLTYLRARSGAPIITRHPWADYQIVTWPGCPRTSVLTGMVGAWVAWAMGASVVILAGMNGYGGKPEAFTSAKLADRDIRCPVRVVGGGPLTKIWPEYSKAEKFGRYVAHPSLDTLAQRDGETKIRVVKPTQIRGLDVRAGQELRVMRHEIERLLRHRMVVEV